MLNIRLKRITCMETHLTLVLILKQITGVPLQLTTYLSFKTAQIRLHYRISMKAQRYTLSKPSHYLSLKFRKQYNQPLKLLMNKIRSTIQRYRS